MGEGHEDGEDGGDARRDDRDDQSAEENTTKVFQISDQGSNCETISDLNWEPLA